MHSVKNIQLYSYALHSVCAQTKFCSIYFLTSTRVLPLSTHNSFHFHHVRPHFVAIIAPITSFNTGIFISSCFDVTCLSAIFQRYTIVIGFNFLCLSVALALRSFLIPELYSEQSYTRVRAVELWFKHFRVQQFDTSHVRNTFRKNARGCRQKYSHVQEKTCASNEAAFHNKTKLFRYYTQLILLML